MKRLFLLLLLLAACATTPERARVLPDRPIVVLMTDFGMRDDAVALLRGVVLSVAPNAQVLDLTHEVPAYDVEAGARVLEDSPGIYPEGTVFVVVVDPGVGTARKPIAVELANGSFLVGPDNGVLSLAMKKHGVRAVRTIEDPRFVRASVSSTFHGRDVFAPAGAHLARGSPPFKEIGPEHPGWAKLALRQVEFVTVAQSGLGENVSGAQGTVIALDEPFGNVWTDIDPRDLAKLDVPETWRAPAAPGATPRDAERPVKEGDPLVFELGEPRKKVEALLVKTFGDVAEGRPLAYWNSRGKLALAINMGDAARTYGVKRGSVVVVSRAR